MSKNKNNYLTVIVTVALLIALDVILTRFLSIQITVSSYRIRISSCRRSRHRLRTFLGRGHRRGRRYPRYDHLSAGRVFSGIYAGRLF